MFDVKYDQKKNRVYLKLEGFVKLEEAIAFREACEAAHKKQKPGASFLMDARNLKTLPQDSLEEVQKTRSSAVKHGTSTGATVMDESILTMQSKRTSKKVDGFKEAYFSDIYEAEQFLNKMAGA